jgi:presenilin-like A22 family membrane protease
MEAVAFGGKDQADSSSSAHDWNNLQFGKREDTSNRLPVVIIIPHLSRFKQLCDYYYDYSVSLLGLGDVLIPGLSVNYAIIFDVARPNRRYFVYFIVNVIGTLAQFLIETFLLNVVYFICCLFTF